MQVNANSSRKAEEVVGMRHYVAGIDRSRSDETMEMRFRMRSRQYCMLHCQARRGIEAT